MDKFARWQNHFQREHVGGREAILEAVRSAGVFRYIASDRAHRLRRGIRGVEVAGGSHALGNVRIDYARFHGDALVGNIGGQNASHAGKADHDSLVIRKRPAGEAGAGATGHKGYAMLGANADHALQLGSRARKNHRRRQAPQRDQPIALIGLQLVALSDQAFGPHGSL